MPRVAQPIRGPGITDTIGHQERGVSTEYNEGKNICMERGCQRERQRERQRGVPVRGKAICSTGEKHN